MAIKDQIVNLILRGQDLISGEAGKAAQSLADLEAEATRLDNELADLRGQEQAVRQLDDLRQTLEQTTKSYEDIQREIIDLRQQYKNNEIDAAAYKTELKRLQTESSIVSRELKQQTVELRNTERAAEVATRRFGSLEAAQRGLRNEIQQTENGLRGTRDELGKLKRSLDETAASATRFGGGIRESARNLAAFAATYVGLDTLRRSLGGVLETGAEFERLAVQFESVYESAEAGTQALNQVAELAQRTPLQLDEVAKAWIKLKSIGLDPATGSLEGIIAANAKVGGGAEELNGIITALAQSWAKGRLEAEELNQLNERMIPAFSLVEKAVGKTTAEIEDLGGYSKLGREAVAALVDELGRFGGDAAIDQMSTFNGLLSNAQDNLTQFQRAIAESGALDEFKVALEQTNAQIAQMAQTGELDRAAEDYGRIFGSIGSSAAALSSAIIGNSREITTGVATIFATLTTLGNGLTSAFALAGSSVTNLARAVLKSQEVIASAFGADRLATELRKGLDALEAINQGFVDQINQDGEDIRRAWDLVWQASGGTIERGIRDNQQTGEKALREQRDGLTAEIERTGSDIKDATTDYLDEIRLATERGFREQTDEAIAEIQRGAAAKVAAIRADGEAQLAALEGSQDDQAQAIRDSIAQQVQAIEDGADRQIRAQRLLYDAQIQTAQSREAERVNIVRDATGKIVELTEIEGDAKREALALDKSVVESLQALGVTREAELDKQERDISAHLETIRQAYQRGEITFQDYQKAVAAATDKIAQLGRQNRVQGDAAVAAAEDNGQLAGSLGEVSRNAESAAKRLTYLQQVQARDSGGVLFNGDNVPGFSSVDEAEAWLRAFEKTVKSPSRLDSNYELQTAYINATRKQVETQLVYLREIEAAQEKQRQRENAYLNGIGSSATRSPGSASTNVTIPSNLTVRIDSASIGALSRAIALALNSSTLNSGDLDDLVNKLERLAGVSA